MLCSVMPPMAVKIVVFLSRSISDVVSASLRFAPLELGLWIIHSSVSRKIWTISIFGEGSTGDTVINLVICISVVDFAMI